MPFAPIETPRLRLRRLGAADAAAVAAYRALPVVNEYLPDRVYDLAWAEALAAEMADREPGVPGTWFQVVAERRADGVVLGDLGLRTEANPFQPRSHELGFTFAPAHQGQGYATEAARALLDHAFGALGAWRVTALCDTRNEPSYRLMERLGMRREGHFVHDWWHRGGWVSTYVYAKTAGDP